MKYEELYQEAYDLRSKILSELIQLLDQIGTPVNTQQEDEDGLPITWVNTNGDWKTTQLVGVKVESGDLVLIVDHPSKQIVIDINEQDLACKYFDSLFLTEVLEIVEYKR